MCRSARTCPKMWLLHCCERAYQHVKRYLSTLCVLGGRVQLTSTPCIVCVYVMCVFALKGRIRRCAGVQVSTHVSEEVVAVLLRKSIPTHQVVREYTVCARRQSITHINSLHCVCVGVCV